MPIDSRIALQSRTPNISLKPLMDALAFNDQRKRNRFNLETAQAEEQQKQQTKQTFKSLLESNQEITPDGQQVKMNGLISGLYNSGNRELFEAGQKLEQHSTQQQRQKQTNFMNKNKMLLQAKGDIFKQNLPYLKALTDPKERAIMLKDAHKQWKMDVSNLPDSIDDNMLESLNNQFSQQGQFINTESGVLFGNKRTGSVSEVMDPVTGLRAVPSFAPKAGKLMETATGQELINPLTGDIIAQRGAKPSTEISRAKLGIEGQKLEIVKAKAVQDEEKRRITLRQNKAKAKNNIKSSTKGLDRMKSGVEALMNSPDLNKITGFQGQFMDWPGSAAANLRGLVNTLESQIGFAVLQNMRDMSATGGALGSVSEREIDLLTNNLANLRNSQSAQSFKDNLNIILDFVEDSKSRLQSGFKATYGASPKPLVTKSKTKPLVSKPKKTKSKRRKATLEDF